MLAEYLGWPQATFAGSVKSEDDKALVVGREIEGATAQIRVTLPAVVTVLDTLLHSMRYRADRGFFGRRSPGREVLSIAGSDK